MIIWFVIEWLNLAVRYAIPIIAESLLNVGLSVGGTSLRASVIPCVAHAVDGCVSDHADYFSCLSGTHLLLFLEIVKVYFTKELIKQV